MDCYSVKLRELQKLRYPDSKHGTFLLTWGKVLPCTFFSSCNKTGGDIFDAPYATTVRAAYPIKTSHLV
jgi:hypothetical protein